MKVEIPITQLRDNDIVCLRHRGEKTKVLFWRTYDVSNLDLSEPNYVKYTLTDRIHQTKKFYRISTTYKDGTPLTVFVYKEDVAKV